MKQLIRALFLIIALIALSQPGQVAAFICTQDLNGNGTIDPATEQWTCHDTTPPLCPRDLTPCNTGAYQAWGEASITATNIAGKSGFLRMSSGAGGNAIEFTGWICTESACSESYAGRVSFTQGTVSGNVNAEKITKVAGNEEKLDIYGCSGSGCTAALLGSITVTGAAFSGIAESAEGLHGVSISGGTGITFTDRNAGAAGTVTLSGMKISCPYGSQFSCTLYEGTYKCSPLLCFDPTAGGQFGSGQKVCSSDLNGDGTIDFASEVVNCSNAGSGYFCPLGAVNCGSGTMSPLCPTNGSDCTGGTYNATLRRCETAQIVVGYRCPTTGNTYADQPSCTAACMQTASCTSGTYNVSVTANESSSYWFHQGIYRTYCSGNQWIMLANACVVAGGNNRSFTISGTACSGDANGGNGAVISALVPSGNQLYVYGCTNPYFDEFGCAIDWRTCGVLFGVLTFHNTVISGEAGRGWNQKCVLNDASGTAFHDSCDWASWTGLGFSGASYESCPLGSYPCTGGTCMAGTACTVVNGCPVGYQLVNNVCIGQPTGGTPVDLDTASHVCEASSVNSCPGTGFSYDATPDICVKNIDCGGGLLDGGLDLCVFTLSDDQCPAGFSYSSVYSACLKDASCGSGGVLNVLRDACEIASNSSCPAGFTLDANSNKCLADTSCLVGIYDATTKKCVMAASSLTPGGYTFNAALDRFELAPACPAGSTYSNTADQCTAVDVPACTPPGIYNAGLDLCETTSVPVCTDAGMTYDEGNNICHALSTCPGSAGILNGATDLCELAYVPACAGSYVWEASRSMCELTPLCSSGSYNSARDRCESAPTGISCPSGYTWNAAAGKCQLTPSCSSGTYSVTNNRCEQPATASYTCPQSGQSYATLATCNSSCIQTGTCMQVSHQSGPYYCAAWRGSDVYHSCTGCDDGYGYSCNLPCPSFTASHGVNNCPGGATHWGYYSTGSCDPWMGCWGDWFEVFYYYTTSYAWRCSLTESEYGASSTCTANCTQGSSCNGPNYSCSAGWTASASTCYQAVSCPSGGTLNGTIDLCEVDGSPACTSGTYDAANGVCFSPVSCPTTGALNGSIDKCQVPPSNACPASYTLNTGTSFCEASPQCSSGIYNAVHDRCEAASTLGCPSAGYYTWNAGRNLCEADVLASCPLEGFFYNEVMDLCTKAVVCPEGGVLSGLSDLCTIQMNSAKCPLGFTYDLSTDNCLKDPCSAGTYNANLDKCEQAVVASCPTGFTYSSSVGMCQANPVCDGGGAYDAGADKCSIPGSSLCPAQYTYNVLESRCQKNPACDSGSTYSATLDLCTEDPARQCPTTDYTYNNTSRQCTAPPVCYEGNFDLATNMCTGTSSTCPLGAQYECVAHPTTGIMQCSAGACFDLSTMPTVKTNPDMKAYSNDGIVDNQTGQCENSVFIFNGKPQECKSAGMSTSFFNCCDSELGSFGPIQEKCGDEDVKTVMGVKAGRCHFIGDYCKEKWPLIGCVQKANMYCCFNSKIGRIIQEQGRGQLKTFTSGWGSTESPECRGLTPDEFQMVDFSKINLSEYFGDVVTKSQTGIQQNMQQKVSDFYQKTGQ